MGQEARIVQIIFSTTFDRVNHQGILFKLCSVGVGGSVLSVLTHFLSNPSQYVVVDRCRSKLVNTFSLIHHSMSWWMVVVANWLANPEVSGVPQGSVLG